VPTVLLRLAGKRDEVAEGSVEAAALAAVYAVNGDQGAFPAIQLLLLSAQDSAGRSEALARDYSLPAAGGEPLLAVLHKRKAYVFGVRDEEEAAIAAERFKRFAADAISGVAKARAAPRASAPLLRPRLLSAAGGAGDREVAEVPVAAGRPWLWQGRHGRREDCAGFRAAVRGAD
jgi:hypothetical protein